MNKIYNTYSKVLKASYILLFSFLTIGCTDDEGLIEKSSNIILNENFDGSTLNTDIWSFDVGKGPRNDGWGNNELQYYTDTDNNLQVNNGFLVITAKKEDFEGSEYTSARIITQGKFDKQYGRFEARMKLPWGQGLWPAFWLLGDDDEETTMVEEEWPDIGEIDIMEFRGQEPSIIHGTIHGPEYSGADGITKGFELTDDRFDTGFHVFGIEWKENEGKEK